MRNSCTRRSRVLSKFVLATGAVLLAATGWGQVTRATFSGSVTDPTGVVIPGAAVALASEETGAGISKTTDASGEFVFDFLHVGTYKLRIGAQGFKTYQGTGLQFAAAQNVRRTFVLDLGAIADTVEVEASAIQVNTVSAEQREGMTTTQVRELPLARRNYTGLLNLGTGVTVSASGAQPGHGDRDGGVRLNGLGKSGTNAFHGSAFENFQSQRLNARNQFLTYKPPLTFNQFGGSLGGPIRKNKIFFFGTYEGYRETFFRLVSENTPTQSFRDQIIQAVPAYKIALDGMPLPNQPFTPGANVGFFQTGKSGHASDNHFVSKGDFRIGKNGNLALTYTHGRPYRQEPAADLHNDGTFRGFQERGTASFVTGGAALTSESRFGYNMTDL